MVNTPAKFKSKLKFNETCIDPNTNEIILYAFNLNEDEVKMFEDFVKRFKHKSVDKL